MLNCAISFFLACRIKRCNIILWKEKVALLLNIVEFENRIVDSLATGGSS